MTMSIRFSYIFMLITSFCAFSDDCATDLFPDLHKALSALDKASTTHDQTLALEELLNAFYYAKVGHKSYKSKGRQASEEQLRDMIKKLWTSEKVYKQITSIPHDAMTLKDKRRYNIAMRQFRLAGFKPKSGDFFTFDLKTLSMPVVQYPSKELRKKAKPVTDFTPELQTLIDNMLETMYNNGGMGLAATQVGVHLRVVVMDISPKQNEPMVFINPSIDIIGDKTFNFPQGCLSIKNAYDFVRRPKHVRIHALDRHGKPFTLEDDFMIAVCIQHEIDHLNGVLFIDHLSKEKQEAIKQQFQDK